MFIHVPPYFHTCIYAHTTWVQSQVKSYQRLKKWFLMPPCLTVSIIRYGSRVKWCNPGKGVAPSPIPWCSSYRKGAFGSPSTLVANFTLYVSKPVPLYQTHVSKYVSMPISSYVYMCLWLYSWSIHVHTWVYADISVLVPLYQCIYLCLYLWICMCTCSSVSADVSMLVLRYLCMYICLYLCICECMTKLVPLYQHMSICACTYVHTPEPEPVPQYLSSHKLLSLSLSQIHQLKLNSYWIAWSRQQEPFVFMWTQINEFMCFKLEPSSH